MHFIRMMVCVAGCVSGAFGRFMGDAPDAAKVRAEQPEGLSLKLQLPQRVYWLGGRIEGKVVFSNTSQKAYHVSMMGDRSGRPWDTALYGWDWTGKQVTNPLQWYLDRSGSQGGTGGYGDLRQYEMPMEVNQWMSFSQPGIYVIRAYSDRVQEGATLAKDAVMAKSVRLVSDPVVILVLPRLWGQEWAVIGETLWQVKASGKNAERSVEALQYLNTPMARTVAHSLMDSPYAYDAAMALYASPRPTEEAAKILNNVRSGRLKFGDRIFDTYVQLRGAGIPFRWSERTNPKDVENIRERLCADYQAAWNELFDAAVRASGRKGRDYYDLLIAEYRRGTGARQDVLKKLAEVQFDLTSEQVESIIWNDPEREEFLPVIRKMAVAPDYNQRALIALAALRPEEARMLIVEDLQRPQPYYQARSEGAIYGNSALLSLPAKPVPELDAYFRGQFAGKPTDGCLLAAAVARYGSDDLLPDVQGYYWRNEGGLDEDARAWLLNYWLKHDAVSGREALKKALSKKTKGQKWLGQMVAGVSPEVAVPILQEVLDDPDPIIVVDAVSILIERNETGSMERCVAALERLVPLATRDNPLLVRRVRFCAHELLDHWKWTPDATLRVRAEKVSNFDPGETVSAAKPL